MKRELNKLLGNMLDEFLATYKHRDSTTGQEYDYYSIIDMMDDENKKNDICHEFFSYAYSDFIRQVASDFFQECGSEIYTVEVVVTV